MNRKKYFYFLSALCIILVIAYFFSFSKENSTLKVYFLDVGQGDASLIRTPSGQNILIDGGPDETVVLRLSEILPWNERDIDLIVLTHPHSDHVRGLIDVLKRYKVQRVLLTGVLHSSPDYIEFLSLIRDKKIETKFSETGQKIVLDLDIYLDILSPQENLVQKEVPNLNNSSIVLRLMYDQKSFLFTGDLEATEESVMLNNDLYLKSDVIKISHHGSSNASGIPFIQAVSPKYAIISCGVDNSFGHPAGLTLYHLQKANIEILRTDEMGTIVFVSNGKSLGYQKNKKN